MTNKNNTMKLLIANPKHVETVLEKMKKAGPDKLHILADFDRTLTYGSINGVKTPSIVALLRDGNHLSQGYADKAHALFDTYHPIELDPAVPLLEKKVTMREWWSKHNELFIQEGLTKADLEDVIQNGHVQFREGVGAFLDLMHEKNIPVVIMSASGCGDMVRMFFQKAGKDYPNIKYITNQFVWDEQGKAIGSRDPIIHSFSKDETVLQDIPDVFAAVEHRPNVLLLGDSEGDLGMVTGFDYKNLLTIGFLNGDYNQLQDVYTAKFDVVLEGDGDFDEVNRLLTRIIE
jgi:5'-nucleotidase